MWRCYFQQPFESVCASLVLIKTCVHCHVSEAEMAIPQELMFQNQLQFNMNVPLTRHNMATHFHKPHPITIERTTSAPSAQGFPMAQLAGRELREPSPRGHEHDGYKFSVLSQDRMAAAVQMAKRDLKTQKLQQRQEKVVQGRGRTRSPSPGSQHQQKPIHGTKQWESRRSRMPKKSHSNMSSRGSRMGVKEHDRNCAPRNAGSQTPPTSPPRQVFLNTKVVPGSNPLLVCFLTCVTLI